MDTIRLIDDFAVLTAGEPFRLFPFGTIVKNGKRREFTKELAAMFRLPHFKPPIKLGSHEDKTQAGGFITALEVREDGLYAVPEWTDDGRNALERGSYRYHSPEVIWDKNVVEDPTTGQTNDTPLVWGDALLHTPHLGEGAALYSVEPYQNGGNNMTVQTDSVTVPAGLWDKFLSFIDFNTTQKADAPTPPAPVEPEQFKAEREDYAAKVAAYEARIQEMEAASQYQARVSQYGAEFKELAPIAGDTELQEHLAKLDNDTAVYFSTKVKALAAQIDASNLTSDLGANGAGSSPADAFNALVAAYAVEKKVPYHVAVVEVAKANPALAQEVE